TSSQRFTTCSCHTEERAENSRKGNTKELQSLLQNRTNCKFVNSFGLRLGMAVICCYLKLELVKLLVKFGTDIRLANREGAAYGGDQDTVL
uniref:Uncharacterized protein n=1 Tax=Leptobrachium leishanense TaxID=445787 RepID=A0A8C5M1L1_9ANUR